MQLRGETIEPFSWKKKNKLDGNIVNVKKIQKFAITKLNWSYINKKYENVFFLIKKLLFRGGSLGFRVIE